MASVYEIVTEKIIGIMETGAIPWHRPWKEVAAAGQPANAITHRPYHGMNYIMLAWEREAAGYSENLWLTYKQALEAGGNVKKGEHGTMVIYWKINQYEDEDGEERTGVILRYYTVFNVEQCENITYKPCEKIDPLPAGSIYQNMPNRPELRQSGGSAFYSPTLDFVNMPLAKWDSQDHYHATLYHELAHSTGHASRLARFSAEHNHNFGSQDYSKEELVAELAAAMVCAEAGIDNDKLRVNEAAYLQSWLQSLKNDKTMLVQAASRAQKAADYILNRSHD